MVDQEEAPQEKIETPREPFVLQRKTPEELSKLITDIVDNKVLTSGQVPQNLLSIVFMPIALGVFADLSLDEISQVGLIYEYYDKAGPRSVNGFPTFMAAKMLHVEDWKIAFPKVLEEQERRKVAAENLQEELKSNTP